jgi:hypothetical protein
LSRRSCAKADDPGLETGSIPKFRVAGVTAAGYRPATGCLPSKIDISTLVIKYFADKSRQGFCSELRETPARWFGIGQS